MRVLLVEDEPLALRRLVRLAGELPDIEIVGTAIDGDTAVAEARRLSPDLVILDVEMPGRNGLAVAAALAGPAGPQIVILSAFERYATDAFEVEATDYLLKPLRLDRLRVAVARAQRRRSEAAALLRNGPAPTFTSPSLRVPAPRGSSRDLPFAEMVWIEAARDYVLIHTAGRSHLLRSTMAELEGLLPENIPRVHRSAFVNLDYVQRCSRPDKGVCRLLLLDGVLVPVGPSYLANVRDRLRSRPD